MGFKFQPLGITHFNSGTKLFQTSINTATLQASIFLNALPPVQHTQY